MDRKAAADPGLTVDRNPTTVHLGDVLYYGESKPGAPLLAASRFVHSIEPFKKPREVFGLDATSVIGNMNCDFLSGLFYFNTECAS